MTNRWVVIALTVLALAFTFCLSDKELQMVDVGFKLEKEGKYDEAMRAYTKAIDQYPNSTFALNTRGMLYCRLKVYEKSLADLSASLQIEPKNKFTLSYFGEVYIHLREYGKAMESYNNAITVDPNDGYPYVGRAKSSVYGFHRLKEALVDLKKAEELGVKEPELYTLRAICFQRIGQFKEALKNHDIAIALDTNEAVSYSKRGLTYYYMKEFDKAKSDYHKVIEIDSTDPEAYNNLACIISENRDNLDTALTKANKAISLRPQWEYYDTRGDIYSKMGNETKAKEDYKKALDYANGNEKTISMLKMKLEAVTGN
jgi:tetratricopeptide (TPR) repeat protein